MRKEYFKKQDEQEQNVFMCNTKRNDNIKERAKNLDEKSLKTVKILNYSKTANKKKKYVKKIR